MNVRVARFRLVALALALWLVHSSGPGHAQTGGASVNVWLTTSDQLALLAPQDAIAFGPDGAPISTTIDVDSRTTYQQIDGFGASFTDSSAWLVSTKLTPAARATLMTRLFDPVAGIGLSYLRQPMGATDFALSNYTYDDVPAGQTDNALTHFSIDHDRAYILPLLTQARLINSQLRIMATPWSPPAWMKSSQSMIGGALNTSAMAPLADYFVKFLQAYQAAGVPIDRITVQNEPHFTPDGYPGMFMEWDQQETFVRDYLGPALANAGLTTGIALWDHNWDTPSYPIDILTDAAAAQYVSGSAFHCYAGTPDAMTTVHDVNPGKDLYVTECSASTDQTWVDVLKFDLESLIIGATRNWARTVLKWNIALDPNHGPQNGGCSTCTGLVTIDQSSGAVTYNVDYYTIGHASKFVHPGARRIASNTFGPGSIEDVAFKNPDGSIALIVLNADSVPRTFKVRVGQQSFLYMLPSSSVATFTWQDANTWTNQLPTVALTAPVSGASYTAPAGIALSATASDADGYVTAVNFYAGTSLLGSAAVSPYTMTWSAVPAGTYSVTAVAIDNLGGTSTSPPVGVTVVPSGTSTPFSGTPVTVPGTIEAEQFDNGGEGIAYHDVTPGNAGGQYRATDVDVEATTDVNGGYDVGWIDAGEWLNYTVTASAAGTYMLDARVAAAGAGGTFHLESNGVAVTGSLTIPNTGGWQIWTTVSAPIQLAATGTQILRLVFDTAGPGGIVGNVNYLRVRTSTSGSTPFSGAPVPVPGTIEAEQFDNGGEGIAYHDVTPGNAGGQYRATDVDIEGTTDVNGGYDVGWISVGEWLNYTAAVSAAGTYTLDARVASAGAGGTFHLEVNGVAVTGTLTIPNTGGWQAWTFVSTPIQFATAGTQILRLVFDTAGPGGIVGNVNYLRVRTPTSGSTPFSGAPAPVPGTIEAEQFDNGGEGIAYHDVTPGNAGGQYRATDVDIETTTDVNGGYDVGWISAGEWLNYTIGVATAGSYTLDARVASSGAGGTFHLEVNGVAVTGLLTIPNTRGWQNWTTVSAPISFAAAGTQILRLVFDTAGPSGAVGNVNYLRIR